MTEYRDPALERAERRLRALRLLMMHVLVYVAVMIGLFAINAVTRSPDSTMRWMDGSMHDVPGGDWWVVYPLVGWGMAVLVHAAVVLPTGGLLGRRYQQWEQRKFDALVEDERKRDAEGRRAA